MRTFPTRNVAMTARWLIAGVTCVVAAGCGWGLEPVDGYVGAPITAVKANVTGTLPDGVTDPRAAVLWTSLSDELLACVDGAVAPQDLYRCAATLYAPGVTSADVDVEPAFPSDILIPLNDLPMPGVTSGDADAKIAWGYVVLYEDKNADGTLNVLPPGTQNHIDNVLGVSRTLDEDGYTQSGGLVVYREGGVSPLWRLFSDEIAYGCDEPPVGFSLVRFDFGDDADGLNRTCTVSALDDDALEIVLDESERTQRLACAPQPLNEFNYPTSIPVGAELECYSEFTLLYASTPTAACPVEGRMDLIGCEDPNDDAVCEATYWDISEMGRPTWWPCGAVGGAEGFLSFFSPVPVTDGLDEVGLVSQQGGGPIALGDIRIELGIGPDEMVVVPTANLFLVEDTDDNGALSASEVISIRETADFSPFDTSIAPGIYPVRVIVDGVTKVLSTWTPVLADFNVPQIELDVVDPPQLLTDEVTDEIAYVTFASGDATFDLDELRVEIRIYGEIPIALLPSRYQHEDNDGDGRFSLGDRFIVSEPQPDDAIPGSVEAYTGWLIDIFTADSVNGHSISVQQQIGHNWYRPVGDNYWTSE